MDISLDYSLILTVWTGSAIPIISTFLGYWLIRRSEARRALLADKKRVYNNFSQAIRNAAQTLGDFRAVQLMKPPSPRDEEAMSGQVIEVFTLPSVWMNDHIMDFVFERFVEEQREVKGQAKQRVDADNLELLKSVITFELYHTFVKEGRKLAQDSEEMNRFSLPEDVQKTLSTVFQLLGKHAQSVATSSLLQMAGLTSLDKGADVQPWVRDMASALDALSQALNKDLKSLD